MTFKKLLKEAAKVDPSTFKVGPKVKVQPRSTEKTKFAPAPTPSAKVAQNETLPSRPATHPPDKAGLKQALPPRPALSKTISPRPQKSVVKGALPSPTKGLSSRPPSKNLPTKGKQSSTPQPILKSGGTDTKSRLRDTFDPDQLIPLAQGPKRDLRTIEEIQNDLWRKKGKNYPSVTATANHPSGRRTEEKTQKRRHESITSENPSKRSLRESSSSEDSFIASDDERPEEFDYRAEIRALFKRKGVPRVELSDDDDDMEASGFEMAQEEARAAKLARMEDEEETRREEERAREKRRRKMEAERKKAKGK